MGYNEKRESDNDRTGSHNIVIGKENNYSSFGGLAVGWMNEISGIYASVSTGYQNVAEGDYSSVSTGYQNVAQGEHSSVVGDTGLVFVDSLQVH